MRFLLLFNRQSKLRLQKWFTAVSEREKRKVIRDMTVLVVGRPPRSCNFIDWRDLKIVYKRWLHHGGPHGPLLLVIPLVAGAGRYASLYFCVGLEEQDNELLGLEVLHRYVELLDKYFGNVCELDIIFNFEKAYHILDEFLMGGEVVETSKTDLALSIEEADVLQEVQWTITY
ncbi:hypothetical protein NHX12_008495 [Muraenolepis orangiensis]|uniref:AP complex subunit sigma n=1 Tax=Muraenolepis orangiensis TaxID=630683 RepID=A0A9Q0I9V5_9TELE|nr:hypothetical protein NHX12_008495 [Muraenolepis orangiensis]